MPPAPNTVPRCAKKKHIKYSPSLATRFTRPGASPNSYGAWSAAASSSATRGRGPGPASRGRRSRRGRPRRGRSGRRGERLERCQPGTRHAKQEKEGNGKQVRTLGGGPRVAGAVVLDGGVGVGLVHGGPQALLLKQRDHQLAHGGRGLRGGVVVAQLAAQLVDLRHARVRRRCQVLVLRARTARAGEVPRAVEAPKALLTREHGAGWSFVSREGARGPERGLTQCTRALSPRRAGWAARRGCCA